VTAKMTVEGSGVPLVVTFSVIDPRKSFNESGAKDRELTKSPTGNPVDVGSFHVYPVTVTVVKPLVNESVPAPGVVVPFRVRVLAEESAEKDVVFRGPKTEMPGATALLKNRFIPLKATAWPAEPKKYRVRVPLLSGILTPAAASEGPFWGFVPS
jgi:hypothetical protein